MRLGVEHQTVSLRIIISMSVPVSTVWQDLLQSKAGECGPHLPKEQLASRKEFVSAVERAANDENQRNVQPELIRLGHAYMKVRKFAKAASDPFQDNLRPDDLLRPVWNIAFVVIKVGRSIQYPAKLTIALSAV